MDPAHHLCGSLPACAKNEVIRAESTSLMIMERDSENNVQAMPSAMSHHLRNMLHSRDLMPFT